MRHVGRGPARPRAPRSPATPTHPRTPARISARARAAPRPPTDITHHTHLTRIKQFHHMPFHIAIPLFCPITHYTQKRQALPSAKVPSAKPQQARAPNTHACLTIIVGIFWRSWCACVPFAKPHSASGPQLRRSATHPNAERRGPCGCGRMRRP
jgi:hypothetical protein